MNGQLDTTGHVQCPAPDQKPNESTGCWFWSDLDTFTQGYVEAALEGWSVAPVADPHGGYSLDVTDLSPAEWWCDEIPTDAPAFRPVAFSDLAPETLARIIADCAEAQKLRGSDGYEATGLEFWMVRQVGALLGFPPLTVQLGDDGKVRLATGEQSS